MLRSEKQTVAEEFHSRHEGLRRQDVQVDGVQFPQRSESELLLNELEANRIVEK
ncbi:hypothetical protein PHLCEN_2v3324 [Hermanssonia centrifuga]|uniref:Uncharacterized protein n=1 Tax=Hermanssonia centrifuga TaxID=98765 RepID=A0A2R6QM77_9APHY|nr:hypothetical protein PHLCEN_2v3324 [Hermanssonia centrifuga]